MGSDIKFAPKWSYDVTNSPKWLGKLYQTHIIFICHPNKLFEKRTAQIGAICRLEIFSDEARLTWIRARHFPLRGFFYVLGSELQHRAPLLAHLPALCGQTDMWTDLQRICRQIPHRIGPSWGITQLLLYLYFCICYTCTQVFTVTLKGLPVRF